MSAPDECKTNYLPNINNRNTCDQYISTNDDVGNRFINWCIDNPNNSVCIDLSNRYANQSLLDRYNDAYLKNKCSSDYIIKDQKCKDLVDYNYFNINLNRGDDMLAQYCNTNNKIFTLNPVDDPSCYKVANYKCQLATTDSDKQLCNNYYINIIKRLENYFPDSKVLYIYYDDVNFTKLPVYYQYDNQISITGNNPKNLNLLNKSIISNNWSSKIFAFVQSDITSNYTFQVQTNSDSGIRFYINGTIILNTYPSNGGSKETISIALNKDNIYLFYIEFYNTTVASLNIKYKNTANITYSAIPLTWYKQFKLYTQTNQYYEDTFLKYMINYPQNFLSDAKYKGKLINENTDVINSIVNYCKQNNKLTDDNNDCLKYIKSGMVNLNNIQSIKLFNALFIERINYYLTILQNSNYTDNTATNFILNELIPYLKNKSNNDISKLYDVLSRELKLVTPELINFVETKDPELTNSFLKSIYDLFKNIDKNPIRESWIKIMTKNCQQTNKDNQLRYQVEDQCKSFLKTNTELNKTVLDYCNADNIQGKYCSDLDDLIINNRVNKVDLPVNVDLSKDLNMQRINLNKTKLIDSKYTDDSAIKYFNNQFKQLTDLEPSIEFRANKYNQYVLTTDALKYCEDNYLDTENKFCKPTLAKYNTQQNVQNTVNKIKEQNCLYNNKFVSDTDCNNYANNNKNYNKFIKANNNYCSKDDNIANDYCQKYYKNAENKINDLLIQNSCTKISAFENKKEKELIIHNVELESFENNDNNNYLFIILLIIAIIFISIIFTTIRNNKINKLKNINLI
jgi:hypothetical protein